MDEWPRVINFFSVPLLCDEEFDGDWDGDNELSCLSFFDLTFLIFFNSLLEKFFLPLTMDILSAAGLLHGNGSSEIHNHNII